MKANPQALANDRPVNARFDRFRAEAEGLLGIRSRPLGGKQIICVVAIIKSFPVFFPSGLSMSAGFRR
jgi:hypothetical protein